MKPNNNHSSASNSFCASFPPIVDNTHKIDLGSVKSDFIKLAQLRHITPAHCLVLLRRTGLWRV